jgi:uncharacterized membrane protein
MIHISANRWRANFFTGLAVVLPLVISVAVLLWLFGAAAKITDTLLFFLPRHLTHQDDGTGDIYWYWSLLAFLLAIAGVSAVGRLTRHYVGRKAIQFVDQVFRRIPLLNKIYGTIKQVNDAFSSENKSAFRQVVLVEFPRPGVHSVGFITGEQHQEVQFKTREKVVSVFIPTTPNPTTGFLVLVPEHQLTHLEMSVADGIKYIISLGSVAPFYSRPNLLDSLPTPFVLPSTPNPAPTQTTSANPTILSSDPS